MVITVANAAVAAAMRDVIDHAVRTESAGVPRRDGITITVLTVTGHVSMMMLVDCRTVHVDESVLRHAVMNYDHTLIVNSQLALILAAASTSIQSSNGSQRMGEDGWIYSSNLLRQQDCQYIDWTVVVIFHVLFFYMR